MILSSPYDPRNDLPEDYPFKVLRHDLTDPIRLEAAGERARRRNVLNAVGQTAIQFGLADAYPGEELESDIMGMDLYAVMIDPNALVDGVTQEGRRTYGSSYGRGIVETVTQRVISMSEATAIDMVAKADAVMRLQTPRLSGWLDAAIADLAKSEDSITLNAQRMRRGATLLGLLHMNAADMGGIPTPSALS